MNKLVFILIGTASLLACNSNDKKTEKTREEIVQDSLAFEKAKQLAADSANATAIQWLDSTSLDMGKVKQGAVVEVSFRFKNSGSKPLVITNVSASCGCTVPEKPEKPYEPGEEGGIKAKFDSKGQQKGEHRKHVTVIANTSPGQHDLNFRVEITD